MIDPEDPIAALLLAHRECASVLQRHRLAVQSGEDFTLAQACRARGLDVARVVDELEQAVAAERQRSALDPTSLSDVELVDLIVTRYHDHVRRLLPFLRGLSAKVAHVHGARHPELRTLVQIIHDLDDVLSPHLEDEEACLFIAIRCGERNRALIRQLVGVMSDEHTTIRAFLARVHATTDAYRTPDGACTSYRLLFSELERLDHDLRQHLQLEDEVLLPRLVAA